MVIDNTDEDGEWFQLVRTKFNNSTKPRGLF